MCVFARVLADGFDVGLVALVTLVLYGIGMLIGPILAAIQSSYTLEIVASANPVFALRSALSTALSTVASDPLYLLATLIYSLFMIYLSALVVSWISKRRTDFPENPFAHALHVYVRYLVAGIIVGAPLIFAFALAVVIPTSAAGMVVSLALFTVFAVLYGALVAPVLPAVVVDDLDVKRALSDGILVGRRAWLRIFIYFIGVAIVSALVMSLFSLISYYVPQLSDVLLYIYEAISFILSAAVATEVYIGETRGE